MDSLTYLAPSWDTIYEMLLSLAAEIKRSGFKPDIIVGISRGGWAPARVISDLLENPHTASVRVEFYTDVAKAGQRPIVTQPITANIRKMRVLLVDDVSDSGESMKIAVQHVAEKGAGETRTATLYLKPRSKFAPDFYAGQTGAWIIFPWERVEATRFLLRNGKTSEDARRTLIESGIDPQTADKLLGMVKD